MKKITLFVIALFALCSLFAQKNVGVEKAAFFRLGIKGGVSANKINGIRYKEGYNYNLNFGAFAQLNFTRHFGIQPEVNLVQTATQYTNDVTDVFDYVFRSDGTHNIKINYIEIPVLLNLGIGPEGRFKIQLGPAFGKVIKQQVDSLAIGGNIYKDGDVSAVGGIFMQWPVLNMGARYKYGVTNINNLNGNNDRVWKNQAIQVFVGLTF
jgi:hypothetical protein